jgi:fatty-acyl-CoA synthase
MLVRPGTLPKTSSGKLQRGKCREEYLSEELDLLDTTP